MGAPGSVKSRTNPMGTSAKATARELLGRALGFRECRPETLDALIAAGHSRALGKNELFLTRGDPFDMLCLVVEGSLEVSLLRHDGRRHLISYLQPGDLVGLMCLIDGQGHVNDLRARHSTRVHLVPGDAVRRQRQFDPMLGPAFEQQLVFRSRLLYERLSADPSMPLDARLARLLHLLIGLYGRPGNGAVLLDMKVSQSDLADWLGASRQRVNFVIQQLEREGLVELRYSTITIVDPAGLASKAKG